MRRTGSRFTQLGSAISRLHEDENGQAMTEYILLLSALFIFSTNLVKGILKILDGGILKLGAQLEKDLKTGRTRLRAWKN